MKKFSILTGIATLGLMTSLPAQGQQVVPMQRCISDTDCVIAESQCGDHTEYYPINRSHLANLVSISGPLCSVTAANPGTVTPTCEAGACQTQPVAKEVVIIPETLIDYSAITEEVERMVNIPEDDTDGEFTAYDLPNEIVRRQSFALLELE